MTRPARPLDDDARVAALDRLGLLEEAPAADLEAVTRLARFITGAPTAYVTVVGEHRLDVVAGADGPVSMDRDDTPCAHVVAEDLTIHTPDARDDARLADGPLVDGREDTVRMYVGVPVHDPDGLAVGTVCALDQVARRLTDDQLAALHDLAGQVEQLLVLRAQRRRLLEVLAEVDHHATYDTLTGLVNRRVLLDRLDRALARPGASAGPALFFCDLDGFKAVNDTLGHETGDEVLRTVARRLQALVRSGDTVARLGGDEFVVLCEQLPPEELDGLAARLATAADPLVDDVEGLVLGLSVGAVAAGPGDDASDVLCAADQRMYATKAVRRAARATASVGGPVGDLVGSSR
ncbi:sensor domain-containing diguanylate cyclase [Pseudokineococcus lusitanus]|uniref:Diguanylate cyclase with GAF sensor n=1 Tax=Pseudokineococcus lusitanus TaxID=763993 RepID=A0A3N1G9Z3_9ACTN|nr:sensor domain-containing diguanylate cyclase [Pseudokineococcus lusitanus]ROP27060.1 diguanylate cyclase with GAF sensor [Pseudokineococcus lusitanus]